MNPTTPGAFTSHPGSAVRPLWLRAACLTALLSLTLPDIARAAEGRLAGDAYAVAGKQNNYGADTVLGIQADAQHPLVNTYLLLDLSSLPTGTTGADVAKATVRLYIGKVTAPGSFAVLRIAGP